MNSQEHWNQSHLFGHALLLGHTPPFWRKPQRHQEGHQSLPTVYRMAICISMCSSQHSSSLVISATHGSWQGTTNRLWRHSPTLELFGGCKKLWRVETCCQSTEESLQDTPARSSKATKSFKDNMQNADKSGCPPLCLPTEPKDIKRHSMWIYTQEAHQGEAKGKCGQPCEKETSKVGLSRCESFHPKTKPPAPKPLQPKDLPSAAQPPKKEIKPSVPKKV